LAFPLACRRFGHPTNPAPTTRPVVVAARPATQPASPLIPQPAVVAPHPHNVSFSGSGFSLSYPSSWKQKSTKEDVLLLVPVDGPESRNISVDQPDLPAHVPGLIPLHLVQNGYVDDLRKQHPGLKLRDQADHSVAGAKGRFVRMTWEDAGTTYSDTAILVVHNDHVYILSLDTDAANEASDRAAFDAVIASLRWEKQP
jgi:hypothetical protein